MTSPYFWICRSHSDLCGVPGIGDDPMHQLSQLLFGEKVRLIEKNGPWAYVEALEQPQASVQGWHGYLGWVAWDHIRPVLVNTEETIVVTAPQGVLQIGEEQISVLLGTRLSGSAQVKDGWTVKLHDGRIGWISSAVVAASHRSHWREPLLQLGKGFLGSPYFWGGRSPYLPDFPRTGVDCSSLANLLYRVYGLNLPRDAHDQFLFCTPCSAAELQPADLVFTVAFDRTRADHTMLYLGGEMLLEAVKSAGLVRTITFQEKLGISRQELSQGKSSSLCRISFGKYII